MQILQPICLLDSEMYRYFSSLSIIKPFSGLEIEITLKITIKKKNIVARCTRVVWLASDSGAACKSYKYHRYLVRAEQLRRTVRFIFILFFLMVIFKVISIFNLLKGLIVEKL